MDCLGRIRELLSEREWSMYQLSQASGIPQSTLSNLFIRCNAPSVSTLEKICRAFGITLSAFFEESHNSGSEEREVLSLYRALSPDARGAILCLMRHAAGK